MTIDTTAPPSAGIDRAAVTAAAWGRIAEIRRAAGEVHEGVIAISSRHPVQAGPGSTVPGPVNTHPGPDFAWTGEAA